MRISRVFSSLLKKKKLKWSTKKKKQIYFKQGNRNIGEVRWCTTKVSDSIKAYLRYTRSSINLHKNSEMSQVVAAALRLWFVHIFFIAPSSWPTDRAARNKCNRKRNQNIILTTSLQSTCLNSFCNLMVNFSTSREKMLELSERHSI